MNTNFKPLVDQWAETVTTPQEAPDTGVAMDLLTYAAETGWVRGDAAAVTALGAALFHGPPDATGPLTPLEALSLASACYQHELAPGPHDPHDAAAVARWVNQRIVRCYRDDDTTTDAERLRRTAHDAAVDLGGASALSVPRWAYSALSDNGSDDTGWYLSSNHYKQIALACRHRAPGRRWERVTGLGYVTWALGTPQ